MGPLAGHPIIPVVTIDDVGRAEALAWALLDGGIRCAEVTLRTPAAVGSIRKMAEIPGFVVGAGTVLTVSQADDVAGAGARFMVSPGLEERVLDRARTLGLGVLPGVATATEIMRASVAGVSVVKFFPAGSLGGLAAIRAFAGPFPDVGFVPSGGVGADNFSGYLSDPGVPAVSGSWMVPRALVGAGDFEAITLLSRAASGAGR